MVLRRQWSRFTLLIQSILCWRGVAKQPQGTEWDSNSGDLGAKALVFCFCNMICFHTDIMHEIVKLCGYCVLIMGVWVDILYC